MARRARRCVLAGALLLAWSACAAEQDPDASGVPDPFGLGERLALIDYLQSHHGAVEPGSDLTTLRRRYQVLIAHDSTESAAHERDAAASLLWRTYGESPPADATLAEIKLRMAALRAASLAVEQAEIARQASDAAAVEQRPAAAHAAAAAPPAPTAPAPEAAPAAPDREHLASIRVVPSPPDLGADGEVELISEHRSPILLVVMSTGLRDYLEKPLQLWRPEERLAAGVDGSVIILGHSDGMHFQRGAVTEGHDTRGELAAHLWANRTYYETMAGTRQAKPIDLAAMCGCNASGANQEVQLRDGFGYRPSHRVFTVPGRINRTDLVGMAILYAGSTPFDKNQQYQARFDVAVTTGDPAVGCYAVVGESALELQSSFHVFELDGRTLTEKPQP